MNAVVASCVLLMLSCALAQSDMGELYQTADWKSEKHVPVIEIQKSSGNVVEVKVIVGKEIPHPNTVEHHTERYLFPA